MGPAVRWIPAVALLASAAACSGAIVGTKFIKTQTINAADGGTIVVSPRDDANLAGLTIVIPPHALASTTTITVAEAAALSAKQLGGATQYGTTVELGQSGTHFSIPAIVTLPFAADGGSDVWVIGVEGDGTTFSTLADAGLTIDAGGVTFSRQRVHEATPLSTSSRASSARGASMACDAGGASICTWTRSSIRRTATAAASPARWVSAAWAATASA